MTCVECDTRLIGQQRKYCSRRCLERRRARNKWATMSVDERRAIWRYRAQRRAPQHKLVPPFRRACTICGDAFDPGRSSLGKLRRRRTCSPTCVVALRKRSHPPTSTKYHGASCRVWYVTCVECSTLVTSHRIHQRHCSSRCRKRRNMREYTRRYPISALRYHLGPKSQWKELPTGIVDLALTRRRLQEAAGLVAKWRHND